MSSIAETIYPITVTKTENSNRTNISFEDLPFGKYFTDHMLEANYENGEWTSIEIKPFQPIKISPSLAAIQYGQSIFEGMKAYKDKQGQAFLFRPEENFNRFNVSAYRMNMPFVPEEIYLEGLRQLVAIDQDWIPNKPDYSLYIRPFMFATDTSLGVRPSQTYKFMIILSPSGPYYAHPMRIRIEEKFTRAAPGGVGFSKNAGNYAASLLPASLAQEDGFDQVLWTDAAEHKWVQEVGTMNVFFVLEDKVITPSLDEGTILPGVTRDSVLTLLKEKKFPVEQRRINIDELVQLYKAGSLKEVFGTGTAATISMVKELKYKDVSMSFDVDKWKIAPDLKYLLDGIKDRTLEDRFNWMYPVVP